MIKIGDFGLSTIDRFPNGGSCGKRPYMAPEMLSGQGYNKQVDLWSMRVVIYALLTGDLPFCENEMTSLEAKICACIHQWLTTITLSSAARRLVDRLLVHRRRRLPLEEIIEQPFLRDITSSAYCEGVMIWYALLIVGDRTSLAAIE